MTTFIALSFLLGTAQADVLPPVRPLQWEVDVQNDESGSRFLAMVQTIDDTPVEVEVFDGSSWHTAREVFRTGRDAVMRADLDGPVDQIRMRSPDMRRITSLNWDLVTPNLEPRGEAPPSSGGLPAELEAIGVIPRSDWGASRTDCTSLEDDWYRMAIHHTAGSQTSGGSVQGAVQALQSYSMSGEYCDVPYQYLVGYDGSIWEGRPYGYYSGATGGGNNDGNIAISFLGCYDSNYCDVGPHEVTDAMLDSAHLLIQTLVELEDVSSDRDTIRGHQEWPDNATACPGDWIMAVLDDFVEPLGPDYAANLVENDFPLVSDEPIYLTVGESYSGSLTFENTGRNAWSSATRLAPIPRDVPSVIYGDDWLSETRVVTSADRPEPGETGTFYFSIQGREVGDTIQEFSLLEEGVTWFDDDGGVDGRALKLRVVVTGSSDPVDTGVAGDTGDTGQGASDGTADGQDDEPPRPPSDGEEDDKKRCGCVQAKGQSPTHAAWMVSILMLGWVRRRRN